MFLLSEKIRQMFLDYFRQNNHAIYPSSSLLPHNDNSLTFVNAGMVQFKDVFLGNKEITDRSIVSCQKCVRAGGKHNDLNRVGHTARHHTFFEMLGNFSFGEYGKEVAIKLSWDFLIKELNLPINKLYVTHHFSDLETREIWKKVAMISDDRIIQIETDDNFWRMGDVGPCGPCTEIFYDHGDKFFGGLPGTPDEDGDRYIEIWNLVFMQFSQQADGSMKNLSKLCIDTGMGLERISAICQNVHNNFDSDLFVDIINFAKSIASGGDDFVYKILADHLRSSAFLMADGIIPSNEDRGYVLRRIIRRALLYIKKNINYNGFILNSVFPKFLEKMGSFYKELIEQKDVILNYYQIEDDLFSHTISQGMKYFNSLTENGKKNIDGSSAFKLYDTYGFPLDLTIEIANNVNISVDVDGYMEEMKKQKERSRISSKYQNVNSYNEILNLLVSLKIQDTNFLGYDFFELDSCRVLAIIDPSSNKLIDRALNLDCVIIILDKTTFYAESGGQVSDVGYFVLKNNTSLFVKDVKKLDGFFLHYVELGDEIIQINDNLKSVVDIEKRRLIAANHTATHLLHSAIKMVLGNNVSQKGSLVSSNRLRFDFNYNKKLEVEQIREIEKIVNNAIYSNFTVLNTEKYYNDAIKDGVIALFGEKYSSLVRVVSVDNFSKELCGGTHVKNTSEIGLFKIVMESSVASGIRRIEAITSIIAFNYLNNKADILSSIAQFFGISIETEKEQVLSILEKQKVQIDCLDKKVKSFEIKNIVQEMISEKFLINDYIYVYKNFASKDNKVIADAIDLFCKQFSNCVVVCVNSDKDSFLMSASDLVVSHFEKTNNKKFFSTLLSYLGLSGGGKKIIQGPLNRISISNKIETFIKNNL